MTLCLVRNKTKKCTRAWNLIQVNPEILVWRVVPQSSPNAGVDPRWRSESGDTLITCLELMTAHTLCLKYAFPLSKSAVPSWLVMITL